MILENITKEQALRSSDWDYLLEGFNGGWIKILKEFISTKVQIDDESFSNLLYRWRIYHILYLDAWEGYSIHTSIETYTIEQFKEKFNADIDIYVENSMLTFKCGNAEGIFFNNMMPKHPIISGFYDNNISTGLMWMIHEEGLFPHEVKAKF